MDDEQPPGPPEDPPPIEPTDLPPGLRPDALRFPRPAAPPKAEPGDNAKKPAATAALLLIRRTRIAEMLAHGRTEAQMMAELGVSRSVVWRDLEWVKRQLARSWEGARDRAAAQLYQRLNHVYAEAIDGWQRSKRERKRVKQKMKKRQGAADAEPLMVEVDKEEKAGDARFLVVAHNAVRSIGELTGNLKAKPEEAPADAQPVVDARTLIINVGPDARVPGLELIPDTRERALAPAPAASENPPDGDPA